MEERREHVSTQAAGLGPPPTRARCLTWTLDSGRLIFRATSSLMKMSG